VGKSGAGKTTIFNLLCKMYDVDSGSITIDGVEIKKLDKDSIRGNITIISQNPYIFNMSIRDNLKLVKSDIKVAEMKALTDTQNEIANQAGPLSQAQAMKAVVEARAATEAAAERANIAVQEQRALKAAKQYEAEVIVPANAQKTAKIIAAEADQQSSIIEADGKRQSIQKIAEGEAEAIRVKKIAEADGEAAKIVKTGEAEGKAIYAKLAAEAKGVKEKAEAYAKLDQTGKMLEIISQLQTLAPNVIKEFAGVMAASTAHLGSVKDIKIVDFGSGKDGQTTISKFGTAPVEILTKFMESFKATGSDPSKLLNFLGIKPEDISAKKE
jgi:ABC-type sugar transport system ATPase subunit